MQMPAIRRLEFDFDFPPGHVAAYLLEGDEPVLVDAGLSGAAGERDLREGLGAHGLDLADVEHVLLTHFHTDHVGQLGTLRRAADPTIHVPTTFRPRMDRDVGTVRERASETMRLAGLGADRIETALADVLPQHEAMQAELPAATVDHWIDPDSRTRVGGVGLDALHTPGHDTTHVSYRLETDPVALVSGDMAIEPFRTWIVRSGWVDGFEDDVAGFRAALDRLAATEADTVYPGHGPVHSALQRTLDRDRESLAERLDACYSAVHEEGTTALEVAETIGRDRASLYRLLPEAVAMLEDLRSRDVLVASEVDGARRYRQP